ncbi:MAG: hypothetical protein LRY52_12315 [Sulfurospirillum cavolei]|nr:hypothetical protein [Sulfurospirillum cavolei]
MTITLCRPAANLALKEFTSPNVKKPDGSEVNPKTALQGLMNAGKEASPSSKVSALQNRR